MTQLPALGKQVQPAFFHLSVGYREAVLAELCGGCAAKGAGLHESERISKMGCKTRAGAGGLLAKEQETWVQVRQWFVHCSLLW